MLTSGQKKYLILPLTKQLSPNKYLCPIEHCITFQILNTHWTPLSSFPDFSGFHTVLAFNLGEKNHKTLKIHPHKYITSKGRKQDLIVKL